MWHFQVVVNDGGVEDAAEFVRDELSRLLAIRPEDPATALLVLTSPQFEDFGKLMSFQSQAQAIAYELAFSQGAAEVQVRI